MSIDNDKFDELIGRAVGRDNLKFDFDKWQERYSEQICIFRSQTQNEQTSDKQTSVLLFIKGKIMKNIIVKLAVAAVIVIAVTVGINSFFGTGMSMAFSEVIKPILNAKTAVMDIVIGTKGKELVIHDEIIGSRIHRTVSGVHETDTIIDLKQMKILSLDHNKKEAVYVKLAGLGNCKNYLEQLRNIVIKMRDNNRFAVENKGLQNIDGRDYIVFVAKSDRDITTILVDSKTALPIRMIQKTPNMQIVCDNMQFDAAVDESRFSMDVPAGYVVQKTEIDYKKGTEAAFVETLRIWAEIIEGGYFPDSINLEDVVKIGEKFDRGLKLKNLSGKQKTDVATRFGQGLVFIRFFKGQGQWHYAGKGIKLGDAEKPVFWYKPKNSKTYRVIYGDLIVRDRDFAPDVSHKAKGLNK